MKIKDLVYGEEDTNEEVLIDLINSKSIQRLKHLSQFGIPDEYYHKKTFSRYEHSLGVLILLRRLNASLKEQIAGLLHDVSHTAFSHVIDWVIGKPEKEDYQDEILPEVIKNSEIPAILEKHNINYKDLLNFDNFTLLERETPSLCADRIDYALREMFYENETISIKEIFSDLNSKDGQIFFRKKEVAEIFAKEYSKLQKEHWGGNEAKARYHILAEALREGLRNKIINISDMMKTDNEVIKILSDSNDDKIIKNLTLLKNGFIIKIEKDDESIILRKKFRWIDPEVLIDNKIRNLSEISQSYREFLEKQREESTALIRVKIFAK